MWCLAIVAIAIHCGLISWYIDDRRALLAIPFYLWPYLTIGGVAFFQRFFFGGPTKRIPGRRIGEFSWGDATSVPYLIRRSLNRLFGARDEVDPNAPSQPIRRTLLQAVSFGPAAMAMVAPILLAGWMSGRLLGPWPTVSWYPWGFLTFMVYLVLCAGFELVSSWRAILLEIGVGPAPPAPVTNAAAM